MFCNNDRNFHIVNMIKDRTTETTFNWKINFELKKEKKLIHYAVKLFYSRRKKLYIEET